jgi:ABC-type bacteriocin/lantibiotic exporter with double-glycine peptidase domain
MQYPIVYQKEKYDCGPACICMICAYYQSDTDIESVCRIAGTDEKGTSIWDMQRALRFLGFQASSIKIKDFISDYDFQIPLIAVIRKFPDNNHYVVIYKRLRKGLIIGDPDKGLREISISEFLKVFMGFLIIPQKQFTFSNKDSFYLM